MAHAVENLAAIRLGNTDEVIVRATVNGEGCEVKVWYSHLYGENEASLKGDKDQIRAYLEQELIAAYERTRAAEIAL